MPAVMLEITAERRLVDLDMLLGRAVARFASDAQLARARIEEAGLLIEPRLASRGVAVDAI